MAKTNTTIPQEEEKKPLTPPADYQPTTFAPPAPTATYEPIYDELQRQIADYVNRTDPQKQAEQDARTQRGRNFWTGANLFANVIANAINASGTAKGAPNMTINDAASQKMYDTWRDADKELKADRKAAQQRLEALRMQDAQFRMADAQARDKAAADAYTRNWQAENEAGKLKAGNARRDYEWERGQQADAAKTKAGQDFQLKMAGISNAAAADRQKAGFEHTEKMADKTEERQTKLALLKKGYDPDQKRVLVGNGYFKAENQNEAANHIWAVYEMLRNAYNADDGTGKARMAGMPMSGYMDATSDIDEATAFIGRTFRSVYKNNPAFKAEYDEYSKEYGASAAAKQQPKVEKGEDGKKRIGGF